MNNLILLPGALGHAGQFNDLVVELASKNISATAIDLPGHGSDPYAPDAITVPIMADAMIHKLIDLGMNEPVNIFGHSLGGYIGLYLCLKFPERVKRLYTLGTKWHWTDEVAAAETRFLIPEKMEQKIPAYVSQLKSHHSRDWKDLLNSIRMVMTDLGKNRYLIPAVLNGIDIPARIALGDRDAMVSIEETAAVYRALPLGQLQVYPNTPHPFEKASIRQLGHDIQEFFNE